MFPQTTATGLNCLLISGARARRSSPLACGYFVLVDSTARTFDSGASAGAADFAKVAISGADSGNCFANSCNCGEKDGISGIARVEQHVSGEK